MRLLQTLSSLFNREIDKGLKSSTIKVGDRVRYNLFKKGTVVSFLLPSFTESALNIRTAVVKLDGRPDSYPYVRVPVYYLKKLKDG
jgi:hypothetical protein